MNFEYVNDTYFVIGKNGNKKMCQVSTIINKVSSIPVFGFVEITDRLNDIKFSAASFPRILGDDSNVV